MKNKFSLLMLLGLCILTGCRSEEIVENNGFSKVNESKQEQPQNTTKKEEKEKENDEKTNNEKKDYIEYIINPDGTCIQKEVSEGEAIMDIEKTKKSVRTANEKWVSYVENPDGTYTSHLGVTYKYMVKVKVSSHNKSYFVFANKKNVTEEDILKLFSASSDANYIAWGMEFVDMK